MLNYPFIRSLSALLDNTSVLLGVSCNGGYNNEHTVGTPLTEIAYEFQSTLLFIAESISTNQKVILQMHDAIITFLLPVLLAKVKQPSMNFAPGSTQARDENESKFLCLKVINDTLVTLLNEESIYIPHFNGDANSISSSG